MSTLILPYSSLYSVEQLDHFFTENKDFFSKAGRRFEAYTCKEGYELVTQDRLVSETFRYADKQKITHELLGRCVHLLQDSCVLHAVKHAQAYGGVGSLPHYLFWLACKPSDAADNVGQGTTKTPEAVSTSDNAHSSHGCVNSNSNSNSNSSSNSNGTEAQGYFEKAVDAVLASGASSKSEASSVLEVFDARTMALYSKHQPASTSLLHTIRLAAVRREELLPMQARLVLNVPNNACVNSAQLMYVLSGYAETAWHYFKRLSTDFNEKQCYRNYINNHVKDLEGHLDLVVCQVSEDEPYAISLKDLYFDEELFCTNIDHVMKRMENAPSLVFADGKACFPEDCAFPDVPYERLNAVEHKFTLRVCGNTYVSSNASLQEQQLCKIKSCNESSIALIPPLQSIFAENASAESRILSLFHHQPTSLHALSQKEVADWFTEASIEELNVAWLSLLCRVQEKDSFTLPGTAEIIVAIQGIAGYLLSKPSFTAKEHLKFLKQNSCKQLAKAKTLLGGGQSFSDILAGSRKKSEDWEKVRKDLIILFECCEDLSCAEKAEAVRKHLHDRFAVTFAVKHDIAYCPFATSFVIAMFSVMLTQVYRLPDDFTETYKLDEQQYCEAFISKGIVPQFIFSSLWTVPQLLKTTCLPVGLAAISFDRVDAFFHYFASPNSILFWHFYKDRLVTDTMINASWKFELNRARQLLLRNVSQVKAELSTALPAVTFANQTITAYDLHQLLDMQLCMLLYEDSGSISSAIECFIGTQTRARVLPTSFPNAYLEKTGDALSFFSLSVCEMGLLFSAIAEKMQYVLPANEQSAFLLMATYILFDTILEQTRAAMPNGSLNMSFLFKAFQAKLIVQEHLLGLYDCNSKKLLSEGILRYPSFDILDQASCLAFLAVPRVQERLSLALYTWPLDNGEIFIAYASLNSLTNLYDFFSDNKAFFAAGDKCFEAFESSGGYVLLSKQQAQATPLYQRRKNVTYEFMGRLMRLFEGTPVWHALNNTQKHHSYLPPYLLWIMSDSSKSTSTLSRSNSYPTLSEPNIASAALSVPDLSQTITSESRRLLSLKHLPSCASLLHTTMLAAGRRQEVLPVHGRLILEVPSGCVNRGQLDYVLNTFADPAYQYFISLNTDFRNKSHNDYEDNPKLNRKAKLELVFQHVASDEPYRISLRNVYFGELLYSTDIHQAMVFLERSGDPLMLTEHFLFHPKLDGFDWSVCKASNNTLQFGAIALTNEKLSQYSEHATLFPCKLLDGDKLCLTLRFIGNAFLFSHTNDSVEIKDYQVKKMHFVQQNPAAFIPPIEQLFVSGTNREKSDNTIVDFFNKHPEKLYLLSQGRFANWFLERFVQEKALANVKAHDMKAESTILHFFHKHPDKLHLLSQKDFANWFLEAPVKEVNAAMLSLLRRVQEKQPFTLPASAQLVTIIQHFVGYLLGYRYVTDAMIKPYLQESRSLPLLKKVRETLLNCNSSKDRRLHRELLEIFEACTLLPFIDKSIRATLSLEEYFKVKLSDGFRNIPYPPIPTAFLIVRFLYLLTKAYGHDDCTRLKYCEILICKGILPLFVLQPNVDIFHLNKVTSLPVELVGITFDLHNSHDGIDYTPTRFWAHDYLFHAFYINSIIDDYWKLLQNEDRVLLMHNIEAMRDQLLKMEEECFTFVNQSIHVKQLLQVFDLLYFTLVHETHSRVRSQTRKSMLLSAFPHVFLEKSSNYFEPVDKENPATLILRKLFGDFTDDMRALLPLKGNSSFPYFAGYLLLDTIIEEARNVYAQGGEVPVHVLFAAFEAKLQEQEQLLYLYEQNWDMLVQKGALYPACAEIKSPMERIRALATPYFQDRMRRFPMDFPLKEVG